MPKEAREDAGNGPLVLDGSTTKHRVRARIDAGVAVTPLSPALFSSARTDWRTPTDLYTRLVIVGGRYDVTDTHGGAFDALRDPWPVPWFANPPYGRQIMRFIERFPKAGRGVALLPVRTDTRWFQDHVLPFARLEFVRGRLHFGGAGPAPFPSMLCWFDGDRDLP